MAHAPHALVLPPIDDDLLPPSVYGSTPAARRRALAAVVASNLERHRVAAAVVAPAAADAPMTVLGWMTSEERRAVERGLDGALAPLSHLRYVDYDQAERDAERLAARLQRALPAAALARASFVGIPRGGLIVLGMLSYALDLTPDQLVGPGALRAVEGPIVVVDDCSLTGHRFMDFCDTHELSGEVVFACLYAPTALARALEEARPSVRVVAARALHDHTAARHGPDAEAWRARWRNRRGGTRPWTGVTEHLCFAWSEPDLGLWDDERESESLAWSLVPPARCLKTRTATDRGPAVPVVVPPTASGPLRPRPGVAAAEVAGRLLVARPDADACLSFDGAAADFWRALVAHGTVEAAHDALCTAYDVPADTLADDLRAFVDTLRAHDLLAEAEPAAVSS